MKLSEISRGYQYEYSSNCECGNEMVILTQQSGFQEYDTDIYVKCTCGEYIHFSLPVN